jgi:hypothetical protein
MCGRYNYVCNLKHFSNCCINQLTAFTKRYDNIGKVIAQAINIYNPQEVIKSETYALINWKREPRLLEEIKSLEKYLS